MAIGGPETVFRYLRVITCHNEKSESFLARSFLYLNFDENSPMIRAGRESLSLKGNRIDL